MSLDTSTPDSELAAAALATRVHDDALVFDCLALPYVLDEPYTSRMVEGGVDAINVTIASDEETWDETLRRTEDALAKIEKSDVLLHARDGRDVRNAKRKGKIAVLLGTQGATMLDQDLSRLERMHQLGFRYFAPSYTGASIFADGCGEFRNAGLSILGQELIAQANELRMIVDVSHCGHRSRADIAELALFPACTHSNAYAVVKNDRNTQDETIRVIAGKGGVIGICGLVRAVWPSAPTLDHMIAHIEHIVGLVGTEHVGLGLDFTEAFQEAFHTGTHDRLEPPPRWRLLRPDIFGTPEEFYTATYPAGLESIRLLPNLTRALCGRGYDESTIRNVLGGNWLRQLDTAAG